MNRELISRNTTHLQSWNLQAKRTSGMWKDWSKNRESK